MTSLKIQPAGARDLAMHRAQYEQLVVELRENGFDADIETLEQRAVLPFSPDIIIHVGEAAGGVAEIVRIVRRVLRGLRRPPSGEPRRAVIYGPDGEVISTVVLTDDDGEA